MSYKNNKEVAAPQADRRRSTSPQSPFLIGACHLANDRVSACSTGNALVGQACGQGGAK